MDLKRFFISEIRGNEMILRGEEFFHCIKVTRHKVGYKIIGCKDGYDYYATIKNIFSDYLIAEVDEKVINDTESEKEINLYIGANKDLDSVIQKCVELGVKNVTPFFSQHTNVKDINISRLERIVAESSKQCGRASLMTLNQPKEFGEIVTEFSRTKTVFFYEFERNNKVCDCLSRSDDRINIVIGGEGGFAKEEAEAAVQNGAVLCTLGKRILRVTTAVVSGVTLCLNALGDI